MEDPYLRGIFSGDRRAYDPKLKPHPQAPQSQTYAAFSPGMLEALSAQLQAGFGGDQKSHLQNTFKDSQVTYIPQPITQVMADFAKSPYQQYGQDTGSPFLNSLLGYSAGTPPAAGTGATGQFDPAAIAAAIAAEEERKRQAAAAAQSSQRINRVPMNRDDAETLTMYNSGLRER